MPGPAHSTQSLCVLLVRGALCKGLTRTWESHVPSLDTARRVTHPQSPVLHRPRCGFSSHHMHVQRSPRFGDAKSSLLGRKGQWFQTHHTC